MDSVTRLCAMNLLLHGIGGNSEEDLPVVTKDALAGKHGEYEIVLANPPFGKKSSVTIVNEAGEWSKESLIINRDDFWASTSNKQLNFLQHIFTILKQHGRAACAPACYRHKSNGQSIVGVNPVGIYGRFRQSSDFSEGPATTMKKPTPPPNKEEIGKLEPYVGLGLESVWVISTAEEAQAALEELRQNEVLGFDTESRPTFVKNEQSQGPHLLQFAAPGKAYLFQSHRKECHPAITELLAAEELAKVGFGLRDDLKFIGAKFGIEPRAVVDLNDTFGELGYKNQVGARTAIAMLFKRRFLKSRSTTTSDWSARTLTEKQILYAANDAYAAIQVFHALKKRSHPSIQR